jgi:hypothetical protein
LEIDRKYLVAVALLAVLAVVFGVAGTFAPPLAGEVTPSTSSSSSSSSIAHFTNPPTYDSGWVNITSKAGQYVTLKHNLNTTDVVVDLVGKQSLNANGGALAWNKTYGGTNNDYGEFVVKTSDGGYALAGVTGAWGAAGGDFCLIKTDSAGNAMWNRTYGGIGDDWAFSLVQTSDGGYALAGDTNSYGAGNYDFWLIKTDSVGTLQWNKTYGGTGDDEAYSLVQTGDGGYVMVGDTKSYGVGTPTYENVYLVKTDSAGNMLWNKTYGGTDTDEGWFVVETSDGGYAIAGYTQSYGGDMWLIKCDASGAITWNKTYGGARNDMGLSVVETGDGGYAIAGGTNSFGSGVQVYLVKTFADGTMDWNKTYGGTGVDEAYSLVQTGDGGYVMVGDTKSYGVGTPTYYNVYLVKTYANGTMAWNETYGGAYNDWGLSVVETSDGGYAIAGATDSFGSGTQVYLVKVKSWTNVEHQRNLGSERGLTITAFTNTTIILKRGETDPYWNYVRVRIWIIKEPNWIYGDINMDGVVDAKDLYILSRNYGKTFSVLSLSGIIGIASVYTVKKRKQTKQPTKSAKPQPLSFSAQHSFPRLRNR